MRKSYSLNDTVPVPGAICTIGIIDTIFLGTRPLRHIANSFYSSGGVLEGVGIIGSVCAQSVESSCELICLIKQNDSVSIGASVSCNSFPIPVYTTGIKSNANEVVKIFPNPFVDKLTIRFSEEQVRSTIKITDLLGKEIKKIIFTGKELTIEKGAMKKGIYFVQTIDEKKNVVTKRIIIQ